MAALRFVGVCLLAAACQPLPPGAECWSLQGEALFAPALEPTRYEQLERELEAAEHAFAAAPDERDAAIWVGRRLGYLGRYRQAIGVYTQALDRHPDDPFLLRHRGHRWLTLREFQQAERDLALAAIALRHVADEVEPDGAPVPGRPPHSTLYYNVYYHWGLAGFLLGDWWLAEFAWLNCLAVVHNDESRVAVTHWLWCARMRLGEPHQAAAVVASIDADMDVVENTAYHQLCLLYAGKLSRAAIEVPAGSAGAAMAFGLAHYDLVTGRQAVARAEFDALVRQAGWSAFGVIAAEAELARGRAVGDPR